MIGSPLQCTQKKEDIVQISAMNSRELKLLHMQWLITALSNDPDLANVEMATLPKVLRTLFVVTGCDYISFFQWRGESNFFMVLLSSCRIYYRRITVHTEFTIRHPTGQWCIQARNPGFPSPYWNCLFQKKQMTAFESNSPESHFKNFVTTSADVEQLHGNWLEHIFQNTWDWIMFEAEMISSTEALWTHWKRS